MDEPTVPMPKMPEVKNKHGYKIFFTDQEEAALEKIRTMPDLAHLNLSKRKVLTQCILGYAQMDPLSRMMTELKVMMQNLTSTKSIIDSGFPSRGPGRPAKEPKVDPIERGKQLCAIMEGTVDGNSCRYTHYEVTAIGKAYSAQQTWPLIQLTEEEAENYQKDKMAWLAAKEAKGEMH